MNLINLIDKHNKIISNLYIGNYQSPIDNNFLKKENIKLIVNCTKTYNYPINENIQMIRLNITDFNSPENNIIVASNIEKILEIINIYLLSNEGVLVHCNMVQKRSAMVVACYLIKYLKLSLKDSIEKIKKHRKLAFLNDITFLDFLKYYELEVNE
jgi:protein-tyrosine phosphatase